MNPLDGAFLDILPAIFAAFLDVHAPDDDAGNRADGKKEGKPHPVVVRFVDDGLDDIRADDGTGAVGDTKKTEKHVVISTGTAVTTFVSLTSTLTSGLLVLTYVTSDIIVWAYA